MKRFIIQGYEHGESLPDVDNFSNKIYKVKQYVMMFGMMLFCMIFLGVGIFVLSLENKDKKECTIPVTSTVVDLVSSSGSSGRTYAPVYEYEFEGRQYRVQSNNYSSPCPFSVGETVRIYVEPNDPEHIYSPKDKTGKIVAYVFIGIGAVGTLVFLALGVSALMRSKGKNGEEDYINEQSAEYFDEETTYFSEDNQY